MDLKDYIERMGEEYAFEETLAGRHMVFLAGPREFGKTILVKNWLKKRIRPHSGSSSTEANSGGTNHL
jgi:predicted AAA+ superfamily ATPase